MRESSTTAIFDFFADANQTFQESDKKNLHDLLERDPSLLFMTNHDGNTPAHVLARQGELTVLNELMEKYGDKLAFSTNRDGKTPLYLFAETHSLQAIPEPLIRHSLAARDEQGNTQLHVAAREGDDFVFSFLLAFHRASEFKKLRNEQGKTPLHIAAECSSHTIYSQAMKKRASPFLQQGKKSWLNPPKKKVFLRAAKRGNNEVLLSLLENNHELITYIDAKGNTALHYAVRYGHAKTFLFLLQYYINQYGKSAIDNLCNLKGETPFHLATIFGRAQLFQEPYEKKEKEVWRYALNAWMNKEDQKGNTLLHVIAAAPRKEQRYIIKGRDEIFKRLFSETSNPFQMQVDKRNKKGETALHLAALYDRDWMIHRLSHLPKNHFDSHKDYMEFVNIQNYAGDTALHEAVRKGHSDSAQRLLLEFEKRINVDICNIADECPITIAAKTARYSIDAFESLLGKSHQSSNADVDVRINTLYHKYRTRNIIASVSSVLCPAGTIVALFALAVNPFTALGFIALGICFLAITASLSFARYKISMNAYGDLAKQRLLFLRQKAELQWEQDNLLAQYERFSRQENPPLKELSSIRDKMLALETKPLHILPQLCDRRYLRSNLSHGNSAMSNYVNKKELLLAWVSTQGEVLCPTGAILGVLAFTAIAATLSNPVTVLIVSAIAFACFTAILTPIVFKGRRDTIGRLNEAVNSAKLEFECTQRTIANGNVERIQYIDSQRRERGSSNSSGNSKAVVSSLFAAQPAAGQEPPPREKTSVTFRKSVG